MVNQSAFEQSTVVAVPPRPCQLLLAAPHGPRLLALADAAIRTLARSTSAPVTCRLTALLGTPPAHPATVTLTATDEGWSLQGPEGRLGGRSTGLIGHDAIAVAEAARRLLGLSAPRFGRVSDAALQAEGSSLGWDGLLLALPAVWQGGAAPLDLPPGSRAAAVAAALEARRLTLAFRGSGEGSRADLLARVEALLAKAEGAADDPLVAWASGTVDAMLTRRYGDAAAAMRSALADDACNAAVLQNAAMAFTYAHDFTMALWAVERAAAISPGDTLGPQRGFAGALAAFHGQRFDAALAYADAALALRPDFTNVLRLKATALVHLGQGEAARAVMADVMRLDPGESVSRNAAVNPLREFAGFHRFLDALAEAGMPA